ncbi:MAG: hypothetical protein HXX09_15055 [Bacteroidetes bacterium]|nr:hypothetical protein [Bacteroidota bacterium]
MSDIFLDTDEKIIDTWSINYFPPIGGHGEICNGKLTVTNKRLHFTPKSLINIKDTLQGIGGNVLKSDEPIIILKSKILRIETSNKLFNKKILITIESGQTHSFGYGLRSIESLVNAVKQN